MKRLISIAQNPVTSTAVVCILLYVLAGMFSKNFFTLYNGVNLFQENAFLGVAAVGVTFVIITGGIDLSVGSVIGWTSIAMASMIMKHNMHPYTAMAVVLVTTTVIGGLTGSLVHHFSIPPFLMTLGTLFMYRGWALLISTDTITIKHESFERLTETLFRLSGSVPIKASIFVLLGSMVISAFLSRFTAYGRSLYAIGGAENSALLMGLPVARNKTMVYAISGFFAGLAGIVALTRGSGDPNAGIGLELDAIAVAVVGGTLLSGGVGGILGTMLGLLIFGIIQMYLSFHSFNSAWTKIVIGVLLLSFILLQKLLQVLRRT